MGSISSDVERKHRHERAERHHATGVERGRHGRKATLRDHAQQRAGNRSGSARAANHRVRTGARSECPGASSAV